MTEWTIYEHLGVQYLAKGYVGSALKVFWHLPLVPEHLPSLVYTGALKKNHRRIEDIKVSDPPDNSRRRRRSIFS